MSRQPYIANPISLLRDHYISKKVIKQKNEFLYFDNLKLPLKNETGSLWLIMEYKDKGFSDYAKKVSELGLTLVSAVDKNEILSYLNGEIDAPDALDNETRQKKLKRLPPSLHDEPNKKHFKEEDLKDIQEMTKQEKDKELIRNCEFLHRIERPIETKTKALRNTGKSFKFAIEFIEKLRDENKQLNLTVQESSNNNTILDQISKNVKGFDTKLRAIILVPTIKIPGNVSLSNIKSLLSEGKYEDHTLDSSQIPGKIEISRTIGNKTIVFEFRSDVQNFKEENWNQVVACFLTGVNNEYTTWPNGDKPAILFNKIKAFYIKYHEIPVENSIKSINATIVEIHRFHRYKDYNSKNKIWSALEAFLLSKKI